MPSRRPDTPGIADSEGTYQRESDPRATVLAFPDRLAAAIGRGSIRGLARQAGLSESVLRSYLRGATFPTLDRLAAIAAASETDLGWLATGRGRPDGTGHALDAGAVERACVNVLDHLRRKKQDPPLETVARLVVSLAADAWKESGLGIEDMLDLIAGNTAQDDPAPGD